MRRYPPNSFSKRFLSRCGIGLAGWLARSAGMSAGGTGWPSRRRFAGRWFKAWRAAELMTSGAPAMPGAGMSPGGTGGAAVGLGYVTCAPDESAADMLSGRYEIEVACERFSAAASLTPFYDPKSARVRM